MAAWRLHCCFSCGFPSAWLSHDDTPTHNIPTNIQDCSHCTTPITKKENHMKSNRSEHENLFIYVCLAPYHATVAPICVKMWHIVQICGLLLCSPKFCKNVTHCTNLWVAMTVTIWLKIWIMTDISKTYLILLILYDAEYECMTTEVWMYVPLMSLSSKQNIQHLHICEWWLGW